MEPSTHSRSIDLPSIKVLRHRAAIRRSEPSLPLKCLLRDQLLHSDDTFFDYGCGYGDDLKHVRRLGFSASGWDPGYSPNNDLCDADVVNLGYVINVIEDQVEREETLITAYKLARKVLVVAARIAVDGGGDNDVEFGDGIITKIQTFQKYFTQLELRLYIEEKLGIEAVSAAPGVFYVFKDPRQRAAFSAAKYRRRAVAPRRRLSELEFERHRTLLEPLIQVASELGRVPFMDEFEEAERVVGIFGSIKRAFKLIKKVTGEDSWAAIRKSRIDDLCVYLALSRFPKRPKLSKLPVATQRSIKEFFGGYKAACEAGDRLLFEAGESVNIDKACKDSQIGRLTSNALFIHRSAVSSLEPVLRVFEGCARHYVGDLDDANVVKLHRFSGKVSYLEVPKFEKVPHPAVRKTIKLSLRKLHLQCIDHSENDNPLLLDQKERMLEFDHPWRERFERFSVLEMQHGLLEWSDDMYLAEQWMQRLRQLGLMIRGNRLLYKKGVARRILPSKKSIKASLPGVSIDPSVTVPQLIPDFESPTCTPAACIVSDEKPKSQGEAETKGMPIRSRKYGIGKEIGSSVYVHSDYEELLGKTVAWAKRQIPDGYNYNVVKLNSQSEAVSFVYCKKFDIEPEPTIDAIVVVNADGTVKRRSMPKDPYIYHHKWLFVSDDYLKFDVEESKKRSREWIALGNVDRSRIGKASYWRRHIVPLLDQNKQHEDEWLPSVEVRKRLKLSTCQLAHLRTQGKIEFKKVRNAYFYRLKSDDS